MKKFYIVVLVVSILFLNYSYNSSKKIEGKKNDEIILNIDDGEEVNLGYIVVKKDEKYGIMDITGKFIIPPNYNLIKKINEKIYFLKDENSSGIYNILLNKELKIDSFRYLNNGMYSVLKENKYGIIDENLDLKENIVNDELYYNGENILVIKDKQRYLIDKLLNKKELKNKYENIQLGIGEYLYIRVDNKYGVVNLDEEVLVYPKYDKFIKLNNKNILIGYMGDESYFINLDKNIEKKIDYEEYSSESNNRIMVLKNKKIGYIDELGEKIFPTKYDGGFSFKQEKDFIQLKEGGNWYLLDLNTLKSKKTLFEDIGEYIDGYMMVEKNEKFGYIDKTGEIKIQILYSYAENFQGGLAVVSNDIGFGVINKYGEMVIPFVYDEVKINESYIYTKKDEKYGLYSKDGREILPTQYEKLGKVREDYIFFKIMDRAGVIKLNGEKNGN